MICINDKFSPEKLAFFVRYRVSTPKEGEEYTIRKKIITRHGPAYLLNEIVNPLVPAGIPDAEGNDFMVEVSWGTFRFAEIQSELNEEELEQLELLELEEV